jgi:class 3 adenylate cyclase/HAMP domain-containing protein
MAGLATLALIATIGGTVAVLSFNRFRDSYDQVASTQLKTISVASRLEQESELLSDLAPGLFVKGLGTGTLLAFTTQVYERQVALQQLIEELRQLAGDTAAIARVGSASDGLFNNADEMSTIIFSKAGTEHELRNAMAAYGKLLEEARQAQDASVAGGSAEEATGAAATQWLDEVTSMTSVVLKLLAARSPDQIDPLEAEAGRILRRSESLARAGAARVEGLPKFQERLVEIVTGPRGIVSLQRQILRLQAESYHLLDRNETLSGELVASVEAVITGIRADIARQNDALGGLLLSRSRILAALGLLGLVSVLAIAAYFQLSVIRRLDRLRDSMRSDESIGDAARLAGGRDEIAEMARSFIHFVGEINRRDEAVRRSQQRLTGAIESISDGFSLYDADDRLVLANARYREMLYPGIENAVQPGLSFQAIVRAAVDRGLIPDAKDRAEEWVAERVRQHTEQRGTTVQQRGGGRWIEIKERRTEGGDTVGIYSDITERREFETRLLEEKVRIDEANQRITEQNRMLETLSNQLSKYLSPQVYSSIFSGQQQVAIASKRKKLTIFFSDIAGFTETTDSLESEELTALLNRYLTEMSRIALEYGATIDKYIGDAILIFFGDPESRGVKEDAVACVNMAVAMQRRMGELQSEWRAAGLERPFQLRIGINTGYCTVGNFGSEDRMDYTIIGGEVNLAARLQTKADEGGILLAHETWSLTRETIAAEEREPISVKGFARPVRNYVVLGVQGEVEIGGRIFHRERPGFGLRLDLDRMVGDERKLAIHDIEAALSRLRAD